MRRGIVAAAMVATLALVGCSSAEQADSQIGQEVELEQEQSDDAAENAEESEVGNSFEEEQQAAIDYLNSDETHFLSDIQESMDSLFDAMETGDVELASSSKDIIYSYCNRVIERSDIPESCEQMDECLKQVAEYQKECAYYYSEAISEIDPDRASDYMQRGNDALSNATMYIDELRMHLDSLKERYQIETGQ